MSVVGVLTQADVGDQRESGHFFFERAQGALDDAVVAISVRSDRGPFHPGYQIRSRRGIPRSRICLHSSTARSIESWAMPGIAPIGFSTLVPGTMNSGIIRSSTRRCVSLVIRRRFSLRRRAAWPMDRKRHNVGLQSPSCIMLCTEICNDSLNKSRNRIGRRLVRHGQSVFLGGRGGDRSQYTRSGHDPVRAAPSSPDRHAIKFRTVLELVNVSRSTCPARSISRSVSSRFRGRMVR